MATIGAVIMWPADNLPTGSLVLDGSKLEIALYPALFAVYGRIYTPPEVDSLHFCLPDCRGQVLRGVDMGSGRDTEAVDTYKFAKGVPYIDCLGRSDRGDGTREDAVGTRQIDAFKQHSHYGKGGSGNARKAYLHINSNTSSLTENLGGSGNGTRNIQSDVIGPETRGDNIALTFITFYE